MAGQPQPPRIVEAFAKNAATCNPSAPVAGGKTAPFPATSQIGIVDGAASLVDGFVALNMTDPTAGGIPPFGVDMNGILFLLSSWIAYAAAGQLPQYDATLQTAMGGYAEGSVISQAARPWATWTSLVDANMTDPDTGGAGWVSSVPLYSAAALAGTNNVVLPGASDYVINVAVATNFTGFVAQRDGQRITLVNLSAGNCQFDALAGGSSAGNQLQSSGAATWASGDSQSFKYCLGLGKWLVD